MYYYILLGAALGFILGLLPGIGGKNSIILMTPVALFIGDINGVVFLVALHSVIHTASSIPAIAYGIPVTSADMATVQDGYPLARTGKAAYALGASLSASVFGGIIGAIFFLIAAPLVKPIILNFGPPEFLIFSIFGLTIVSAVSESGLLRGWIVCMLGMLFAMVGVSPVTSDPRFTFTSFNLWEGIPIQMVVAAIFVLPEMLSFYSDNNKTTFIKKYNFTLLEVFRGIATLKNYRKLTIISSWYGIMIGMLPGVGSSVACWMSYAYAKKHVASVIPYGEGAIAGVIGPESANNSKEGGALLPTLLIGIPGSSVMAIMMASFISLGLPIGSRFFANGNDLVIAISSSILVSNIIAFPLFIIFIPFLTKITLSETKWVALIATVLSFNIAIISGYEYHFAIIFTFMVLLGLSLKHNNWARAPFILGFVLWPLIEKSTNQIIQLWGFEVFHRPIFVIMLIALVILIFIKGKSRKIVSPKFSDTKNIFVAAIIILFTFAFDMIFLRTSAQNFKSLEIAMITMPLIFISYIYTRNRMTRKTDVRSSQINTNTNTNASFTLITAATAIYMVLGAIISSSVLFLGSIYLFHKKDMKISLIIPVIILSISTYATCIYMYPKKELIGYIFWRGIGY